MEDVEVSSFRIHPAWRSGWKPSDHAPVTLKVRA